MAQNQIRLIGKGANPVLKVSVPQEIRGQVRVRLWDADGRNPEVKLSFDIPKEGLEVPPVDLIEPGGNLSSLNLRTLTWAVRFAPQEPGTMKRYEVRVWVEQSGRAVPGGEFLYSGPFDDNKELDEVEKLGDIEEIGDVALLMVV